MVLIFRRPWSFVASLLTLAGLTSRLLAIRGSLLSVATLARVFPDDAAIDRVKPLPGWYARGSDLGNGLGLACIVLAVAG